MSLQLIELSDVGGAEVRGLDIRTPPQPEAVAALEAALDCYGVLLFRNQPLSAEQLVAFARCFGPVQAHVQRAYQHPEVPEVVMMTSVKADGSFDEVGARRNREHTSRLAFRSVLRSGAGQGDAAAFNRTAFAWWQHLFLQREACLGIPR